MSALPISPRGPVLMSPRKGRPGPSVSAIHRHKGKYAARGEGGKDPLDWFVEEEWCADVVIDVINRWHGPVESLLDPCAGRGTIPSRARALGVDARGSDVADRGFADVEGRIDFLLPGAHPPNSVDWVVFNPPYWSGRGAALFLAPALATARIGVAMLVNLPYLAGQDRYLLFRNTPLTDVVILSIRPSMPPGALLVSGAVEQRGGKEDYCWLVFRHGAKGPPDVPPRTHFEVPSALPEGKGMKIRRGRSEGGIL